MNRIILICSCIFFSNCLTMGVIDKAYPGPVPVELESIKSIDFGKDLMVRFKVDTGWRGIQEKCYQFNKEHVKYREEIRTEKVFNCESFQLLSQDIQANEIKNSNGLLVLPSNIDRIVDLRDTDFYNFLRDHSYIDFPKMNLTKAEIDSTKNSIILLNDKNQYIIVKRYEEWNKKVLYVYSCLEKIEAPYLKFLNNTLEKNELEYSKEKNTKLPLIPIQKPILVLYYHLDAPEKESKKMIFEISNLKANGIYSLHLDMRSLYEGYAPWYLGLTPFTVVLDVATSPFQAVYFVMYIMAKGSIHH